ncbi:putative ABC transport system permease protein [Mariniphaga anaerophila]|uniref:Putative ABC transport system permease protein n=1 Tax=Mariniphaga anaerophila TaxID=1484053 RepID=A0A1M5FWN1_9BACT|nr:ABC transporter permease [Mariniphaga anaerophila]SHF95572.1 putative ABC transport system permease protein [Mariniphaga anaerophila]
MLLVRLIFESFSFAFNSLRANKLRTFLSLLGITIGIFAIISVFTVIDSLERYIRESLNSLGTNMVYIQKWPWAPPEGETEYPWWKYMNRPAPEIAEAAEIMRRGSSFQNAAFFHGFSRTVQHESNQIDNTTILATSYDLFDIWNLKLSDGRYFTESEMQSGAPVALIGAEIAAKLFPGQNPVGEFIKIQGFRFQIIGLYERTGQDMFGTSMDNNIQISVVKSFYMVDIRNRDSGQSICVKAKPGADQQRFIAELEGVMRSIRRLKPMEENNFALNEVSLISNQFDQFFIVFNMAGWIIGGFSIIVGGFGIANIMFVSVKERTKLIGIQKSLGAKKYFILLQFIFEAVVLSVIGGTVGLILIFFGTLIVNSATEFTIFLTASNIIKGLMISCIIGFIAGLMPARAASRLNPVEAMNAV